MMQGRTSFIVAHRLSTIREADVILVMKDGHIVEHYREDRFEGTSVAHPQQWLAGNGKTDAYVCAGFQGKNGELVISG